MIQKCAHVTTWILMIAATFTVIQLNAFQLRYDETKLKQAFMNEPFESIDRMDSFNCRLWVLLLFGAAVFRFFCWYCLCDSETIAKYSMATIMPAREEENGCNCCFYYWMQSSDGAYTWCISVSYRGCVVVFDFYLCHITTCIWPVETESVIVAFRTKKLSLYYICGHCPLLTLMGEHIKPAQQIPMHAGCKRKYKKNTLCDNAIAITAMRRV